MKSNRFGLATAPAAILILVLAACAGIHPAYADTEPDSTAIPGTAGSIAVISPIETRSSRLLTERLAEAGDRPVVEISISDVIEILELASLAEQEAGHVASSRVRSFLVPGWGQYANGDTRSALLYFLADTTVGLTTIGLCYWLLPPSVQWRNLNYLQTPFESIRDRWAALSASELIPSISVSIAGSILGLALRHFAAENAEATAIAAIEEGLVGFEPRPIVFTPPW